MNLKEILNATLGESGFLQKQSFANTSDPDDIQMVAIANRMAQSILEHFNWSSLRKTGEITLLVDTTSYPLPADFSNMVPDSVWEEDGSRQVEFPTPDTRWYMYKFSALSDGGTIRAKIHGKNFEIYETDPGQKIKFEYVSKYPVQSSGGTPKQYFTQDDDEFVLDDELLIKGVQYTWAQTKMMPQAPVWKQAFDADMNSAIARDSGGRTIGGRGDPNQGRRDPYTPLWKRT